MAENKTKTTPSKTKTVAHQVGGDKKWSQFLRHQAKVIEERKKGYIASIRDWVEQVCQNKFRWEGLPDNLESWDIEQKLYFRGALCVFEFIEQTIIMPFTAHSLDFNANPKDIMPQLFNGTVAGESDTFFKRIAYKDTALLYDRNPTRANKHSVIAMATLNEVWISDLAEILARLNLALRLATKKMVIEVADGGQREAMEIQLSQDINTDSPFIVTTGGFKSSTFAGINGKFQELWQYFSNATNTFLQVNGIQNAGTVEKKERMIRDEMSSNTAKSDPIKDIGLYHRRLWLEKAKKLFPILESVTVDFVDTSIEIQSFEEDTTSGGEEESNE